MKTLLSLAACMLFSFTLAHAASDYYLKIDGVKGESAASAPARATAEPSAGAGSIAPPPPPPQAASVDMFLKLGGVDGETSDPPPPPPPPPPPQAPAPGVEPDEIDVALDGEPLTPDFGILLGGGIDQDDDGDSVPTKMEGESRAQVAKILKDGAAEEGMPLEEVSLNFEKIKTKVKQPVKLFGIIPVSAKATVEIDAEEQVKVKFPWWAFLASGKDSDALGKKVFTTLSNVLKTKHDTIKNSIGNIR